MPKNNMFSKPFVYIVVIVYIVLGFSTLSLEDRFAYYLFSEDRYFENIGAFSFFLTSLLFFYTFLLTIKTQSRDAFFRMRQIVFFMLALMFLFGGGEEISWGQRIFNIETPEALARVNAQNEITVHNIEIGGYVIPFETFFDVFWLTLTIIIPLVSIYVKPFKQFADKLFFIVPLGVGFLFLFNYLWAKAAEVVYVTSYSLQKIPFIQAVQEIKESNYSVLFVFVAVYVVQNFMLRRSTSNMK